MPFSRPVPARSGLAAADREGSNPLPVLLLSRRKTDMPKSAVGKIDYWFGKDFCAIEPLSEGRSSGAVPTGAPAEDRLPRLWHQPCPLDGGNSNGLLSHTDYSGHKKNPEQLVAEHPGQSYSLEIGGRAKARLPLHKDSIFPRKFKITVTRSDFSVRAVLSHHLLKRS